uniref:Uncharacterized protein n=1 Tax=Populus davidiana TaxID=266767 RepID=A0A6M2FD61_9ROSI
MQRCKFLGRFPCHINQIKTKIYPIACPILLHCPPLPHTPFILCKGKFTKIMSVIELHQSRNQQENKKHNSRSQIITTRVLKVASTNYMALTASTQEHSM